MPKIIEQWHVGYRWPHGPIPTAMAPIPYAGLTQTIASSDVLWVVDGMTGVLQQYDQRGTLVRTVHLPIHRVVLDRHGIERRRRRDLEGAMQAIDSSRINAIWDIASGLDSLPAADGAVAGAEGEIWLRLFAADSTGNQRFVGVDSTGHQVATLFVPGAVDVQQVGKDFVLGVRRGSQGEESVVMFVLRR